MLEKKKIKYLYSVQEVMSDETEKVQNFNDFIKSNHYSGSVRGTKARLRFQLMFQNKIIGAALYGQSTSKNIPQDWLELRRFVLINNTLRNAESFFIGYTIRHIKKYTQYKKIISYADPNIGHEGIIYKASNFNYQGFSNEPNPRVFLYKDKVYHLRTFYDKKSKTGKLLRDEYKKGFVEKIDLLPKHVYTYDLR